jgi:hypothetical protein
LLIQDQAIREKRELTENNIRAEKRMQEDKLQNIEILERVKRDKQDLEDKLFTE